jgi:hypothetical protein
VNKTQQFLYVNLRKAERTFAQREAAGTPHPSVFHNLLPYNPFITSDIHLYDFCWKMMTTTSEPLARPKKRQARTVRNVTNRCVFTRG